MQSELESHTSLEDLQGFLAGNSQGTVLVPDREQAYEHIGRVLRRFSYWTLGKAEKGLSGRYLARTLNMRLAAARPKHWVCLRCSGIESPGSESPPGDSTGCGARSGTRASGT